MLIRDSVKMLKFGKLNKYLVCELNDSKLQIRRKKRTAIPWCLTEIIKLFTSVSPSSPTEATTLKKLANELPDRSLNAMTRFLSEHYKNGLAKTLIKYKKQLKSPYTKNEFQIIRPVNRKESKIIRSRSKTRSALDNWEDAITENHHRKPEHITGGFEGKSEKREKLNSDISSSSSFELHPIKLKSPSESHTSVNELSKAFDSKVKM